MNQEELLIRARDGDREAGEALIQANSGLVDLCTQPELKAMEQRYEVARMLDRGMIYSDILAETSASSATISRVNRCLTGGTGGYERAFAKVDAEEKK